MVWIAAVPLVTGMETVWRVREARGCDTIKSSFVRARCRSLLSFVFHALSFPVLTFSRGRSFPCTNLHILYTVRRT